MRHEWMIYLAVIAIAEVVSTWYLLRVLRHARLVAYQLDRANVLLIRADSQVNMLLRKDISEHFRALPRELDYL